MCRKLKEYVNNSQWQLAHEELERLIDLEEVHSDEFYIMAAAVYRELGDNEKLYNSIKKGLEYNYSNYELYFMLGQYYENININQAWLCYENAEFYCENEEDIPVINEFKINVENHPEWNVKNTSFVILSYNQLEFTKDCIESIRKHNKQESYEIIVIDNYSQDSSVEWLKAQEDIKLICNSENKGFPYACNQGIKIAEGENNIFLLNNDTIVMPNSIFWLRMGLYEADNVGATGSVTNHASNGQVINAAFNSIEEYEMYAKQHNVPELCPYENKIYLVGYAMLIKREALDSVGFLDVRYSPGTFEDNDIGVRLVMDDWKVILCHNSFIYHYGSGNGKNADKWNSLIGRNANIFKEKWNFDIRYYTHIRRELIAYIKHDNNADIKVLEVGCGLGNTLSEIKYRWPNSQVKGIEIVDDIVRVASKAQDIIKGDIENMELPYEKGEFDYIILGDVLEHLRYPEMAINKLIPYLAPGGHMICSIPNVMHMSVIMPLLKGKFEYMESGILDNTHLRFFTLDSICNLFNQCGMQIEDMTGVIQMNDEEEVFLEKLMSINDIAPERMFKVYQYVFSAKCK